MRVGWKGLALTAASGTLLAGCGGASTQPSSIPSSAGPGTAVRLAAAQLVNQSFRVVMTSSSTVDGGGALGQSMQGVAGASGGTIDEQVQDATTASGKFTAAGHTFYLVIYKGTAYVSKDQVAYESAPFLTALISQLSADQFTGYADHLRGTTDAGTFAQDGVTTERYDSTIDPAYFTTLSQQVATGAIGELQGSALSGPNLQTILAAYQFKEASLNWYLAKATGHLVRATVDTTLAIDLGKLFPSVGARRPPTLPTGMMTMHTIVDAHFSGYGDHVVIARPQSARSLNIQQFGAWLAGSAGD